MSALRHFLFQHRLLALGVVLAALALKLVVPAGFMLANDTRVLTIRVCEESSASQVERQIAIPVAGDHGGAAGKQAKDSCPFAGHAAPALAGAHPILLALALAFVLALGFAPVHRLRARPTPYLRPPLRAPPAQV